MRLDGSLKNQVTPDAVARILTFISSPPNIRRHPLPGDRRDRHFDAWFDGGAMVTPTGGASEYFFDDGMEVIWAGLAPRLHVRITWPDGRAVNLEQVSD